MTCPTDLLAPGGPPVSFKGADTVDWVNFTRGDAAVACTSYAGYFVPLTTQEVLEDLTQWRRSGRALPNPADVDACAGFRLLTVDDLYDFVADDGVEVEEREESYLTYHAWPEDIGEALGDRDANELRLRLILAAGKALAEAARRAAVSSAIRFSATRDRQDIELAQHRRIDDSTPVLIAVLRGSPEQRPDVRPLPVGARAPGAAPALHHGTAPLLAA